MQRVDEEVTRKEECRPPHSRSVWIGLVITLIGVGLLLRKMEVDFLPGWLFSWPMLLIIWGLFLGIKHRFRDIFSVVLIVAGAAFIARDAFDIPFDLQPYFWPIAVIILGLIIMVKPKKPHYMGRHHSTWRRRSARKAHTEGINQNELDSTAIFCGTRKTIISKDFRGGDIVTVFGGTELNMMQADINGQVVLDVVTVFGGLKLILPPHWEVRSNLVSIAGGVEDSRPLSHTVTDNPKVLILEGTVILGGVEIKSY